MKMYTKPVLECVELRVEERLASNCTGSCPTDYTTTVDGETVNFFTLTYS